MFEGGNAFQRDDFQTEDRLADTGKAIVGSGGGQAWFSLAELAALALPGLPADKRSLSRWAKLERWDQRAGADGALLARRRIGRGGGVEYHASLLPAGARLALVEQGLLAAAPETGLGLPEAVSAGRWRWFDGQNSVVKAKAEARMKVVAEIELLEAAGLTRTAAVAQAARGCGQSTATLWSWLALIDGVPSHDRLPAIAPRFQGGGKAAAIDPALWEIFKSDYLRPSEPTLAVCYAKAKALATERGLSLPSQAAFRRRFEKEVPQAARLLARKGVEALRRSVPSQRRKVDAMHALQLVNIDGHVWDVFVTPPEGGNPIRPVIVGIQDVYSGKLLAWRIGATESAVLTRLAFADLFANHGIPLACLLDNGRAFASKWITGGAKTRYRFKIREEDPTGLLTGLSIKIHWALPYRGQSKLIERTWKDLGNLVSRSAAFDGAYTGNNPQNKPDNYGKKAIPWDLFVAEVARGIALNNARAGRRGGVARGRSYDEVFAESYATAPIGKATPEHLRRALLTAESLRVNKQNGEIGLYGNRYWSPFCSDLHGKPVIARFDPENLHQAIHIYDLNERFLGDAALLLDVGHGDVAGAQAIQKLVADHRKATREVVEAHRRLDAAQVAAIQREIGGTVAELPEPSVIRPVRPKMFRGGQTVAALKALPEPAAQPHESKVFAALGMLRAVE